MNRSDDNREPALIDARLVKTYPLGSRAKAFTLDVHLRAGTGITALLGPSGAGKSLTLNCLAGFAKPDSGRILVNGQIYFDAEARVHLPPSRRGCAYIFQDHALFPHMTVRDNLRFAGSVAKSIRTRGLPLHRRISELLQTFELSDQADRFPAQLSGGQRQRAALARILVNEPRILLLDEPARGLDDRLRQLFYEVLKDIRQRLPIPIVLVTHDVGESFALADSIYLLDEGRLVQAGTPSELADHPANAEAARFFGFHQLVPAVILALDPGRNTSRLDVLGQTIEGPYLPGCLIGDSGLLCLRQSDLTVSMDIRNGDMNSLKLARTGFVLTPSGICVQLEGGLSTVVSPDTLSETRRAGFVTVYFPKAAVSFVSGS